MSATTEEKERQSPVWSHGTTSGRAAVQIGGRCVSAQEPAYIVAELSANHNQDFDRAVSTVKAARAAGADAVKLQTYTPDTMTIDCDNEYFRIGAGTLWEGRTLFDLYAEEST